MTDLNKLSAGLRSQVEKIMATEQKDGGGKDAKKSILQRSIRNLANY